MNYFVLTSALVATLATSLFIGCVESTPITPDAMVDAPMQPKPCALTPIAKLPDGNPGSGFVGIARQADGTVLVASTLNVYKANIDAGTFTKVAGAPSTSNLIVGISAAPNQPTLVANGGGIYKLTGSTYTLLATVPGHDLFTSIAQEEGKVALVTTARGLYSFDVTTNQLTYLSPSPDGHFFRRLSRRPGLDALVATASTIYRIADNTMVGVVSSPEFPHEQMHGIGQAIAQGFVFATGYFIYVTDAAGTNVMKIAKQPKDEWLYFSDISVGGVDDILVTSGHYLYQLDISCVKSVVSAAF